MDPSRWRAPLLIAFVGKVILLIFLMLEHGWPLSGPFYFFATDTSTYLNPIESLLSGSGYVPDLRLPGYGAVYGLLRLFFDPEAAMNGIVLLQLMASAATVVITAKLAHRLYAQQWVYTAVFWTMLVSTFLSVNDNALLTETFAAFALVLALYSMSTERSGTIANLILAGAALTWLVFLKPIYLPLFALFALPILFSNHSQPIRTRILQVFTLGAALLVVDGAWVARNFALYGRFQPLTKNVVDMGESNYKYPVMKLMQAYGCNYVWWDSSAEIRWFNIRAGGTTADANADTQLPLPSYTRTMVCTKDTLKLIAMDMGKVDPDVAAPLDHALYSSIEKRCDRCIAGFRNEHPFHYHVTARLRLLKLFLLNSGTGALMGKPRPELSSIELGVKVFYSFLYVGSILFGTIGALFAFFSSRMNGFHKLVPATLFYGMLIFPFGVRMCENRYATTFYPLAVICAIGLLVHLLQRTGRLSST